MSFSSHIVVPSLAALGAFALASSPSSARADTPLSVSPSLSLSGSFGQKVSFGLGFDVHVAGLIKGTNFGCYSKSRAGIGGFGQVTWLNFQAWRFAVGAHGGGELYRQVFAIDGELGWTYRTRWSPEHPGEHGLHVGSSALVAAGALAPSIELPVRLAIPFGAPIIRPEVTVGVGARFPQMFGIPGECNVD